MAVISTGASIFRVNVCKLGRLLDTVDLEEPPDSRERTGARVLWLSCELSTIAGLLVKAQGRESKIVVMSQMVTTKNAKQKEVM